MTVLQREQSVEVEEITPAIATQMLEGNVHNRTIRQYKVEQYARDMSAGNWLMTGEAIKFAHDGTLLDGQHRLWAIIESGVTVRLLVVRGIEHQAQDVMDTGIKRAPGDALHLSGYQNVALLSSVARLGVYLDAGGQANAGNTLGKYAYSNPEILGWVQKEEAAATKAGVIPPQEAVRIVAASLVKRVDLPPTALAYAYYRLHALNPTECERFFEGMATMSTEGEGDPRYAVMRFFMKQRSERTRLNSATSLSVIYRAWNAFRKGKRMSVVRTEMNGKMIPIPKPLS